MESNNSDENYQEFREERGPNGRKVFVRTTKTQKSITTTTSSSLSEVVAAAAAAAASTSTSTPVPQPRRQSNSTTLAISPSGVCSNITTIVFREEQDAPPPPPNLIDAAADFVRLEALARQREESAPGVVHRTKTTTTVHQRTVTQLNQDAKTSASPVPSLRPTTLQMQSSDNDSLLEELAGEGDESATFQNIHKFTSTYESTPVSSPRSGRDRLTSGDSLYRSSAAAHFSSSPLGSPLSSSGGSHNHELATDEWRFNRTHQFQTRSGFYRSISQYDSHIKEIRGERRGGSAVVAGRSRRKGGMVYYYY